jgi:hypothetical protein
LIGLLYASFSVNSAKTQTSIELARDLISQQKYDDAKTAVEKKSFSSLFNSRTADTLNELKDSIDGLIKKSELLHIAAEQADSLFNTVLAISGTADSLFGYGFSGYRNYQEGTTGSQIINDFIDKFSAENLKLVWKYYESANSFGIVDKLTSVDVKSQLDTHIPAAIALMLKEAGNIIQVLLKNNQKEKAKIVYREAREVLFFANEIYLPLPLIREDTLYFHTYYNELQ